YGGGGEELESWIEQCKDDAIRETSHDMKGRAIIELSRAEVLAEGKRDLRGFFASRHSIRSFDNDRIERSLIEEAVRMALFTPSACNRQPWRVYVVDDHKLLREVLNLQGGNRGFGDTVPCVLVVTGDLSATLHVGERYQPWLDGGMFAMSLVYAFHS